MGKHKRGGLEGWMMTIHGRMANDRAFVVELQLLFTVNCKIDGRYTQQARRHRLALTHFRPRSCARLGGTPSIDDQPLKRFPDEFFFFLKNPPGGLKKKKKKKKKKS